MEFKRFERTIQDTNGVKLSVLVIVEVDEDDIPPEGDFDFGNEEENDAYLNRFKSGELFRANILVKAIALGFEGFDSLGACHIHSNNMFNSKPFDQDVEDILREYGMIDNAIEHLVHEINCAQDKLSGLNFRKSQFSSDTSWKSVKE